MAELLVGERQLRERRPLVRALAPGAQRGSREHGDEDHQRDERIEKEWALVEQLAEHHFPPAWATGPVPSSRSIASSGGASCLPRLCRYDTSATSSESARTSPRPCAASSATMPSPCARAAFAAPSIAASS